MKCGPGTHVEEGYCVPDDSAGLPDTADSSPGPGTCPIRASLEGLPRLVTNTEVRALLSVDLDGDDILDLAYTQGPALAIALNDGPGLRATTFCSSTSKALWRLGATDLDGDGDTDIAGLGDYGQLYLFLNDGAGSMSVRMETDLACVPGDMAFEDIDGDGDQDGLLPCNGALVMLKNEGDGSLVHDLLDLPLTGLETLHPGDLDNDGDVDLLLVDTVAHGFLVFENQGTLTQTQEGSLTVLSEHYVRPMLSDLDVDGDLDLVTLSSDGIAALLNDGTGRFEDVDLRPIEGLHVDDFTLTDVDGDGSDDLLTNRIELSLQGEDGSFALPMHLPDSVAAHGVAAVDLSMDGNREILSWGAYGLVEILADGEGGFVTFEEPLPHMGLEEAEILSGNDVNGDGDLDLLIGDNRADEVYLLINQDGEFERHNTDITVSQPEGIVAAQLDGDGFMDLAIADRICGIRLCRGWPEVIFTCEAILEAKEMMSLGQADLDNDGDVDLVATTPWGFQFFWNDGDMSFRPEELIHDTLGHLDPVVVADIDGDGLMDIAAGDEHLWEIVLLRAIHPGVFQEPLSIPIKTSPHDLDLADLDGDGQPELVAVGKGGVTILSRSPETPDAWTSSSFSLGATIRSAAIKDLDLDGDLDIATVEDGSGYLRVAFNDGHGGFDEQLSAFVSGEAFTIEAFDLGTACFDLQILAKNWSFGFARLRER